MNRVGPESRLYSTAGLVERFKYQCVLSGRETFSVDDHIRRAQEGDEWQYLAFLLTDVDFEVVSLRQLGSNVLDLHCARLACLDLDSGRWRYSSDKVVSEDSYGAGSNSN